MSEKVQFQQLLSYPLRSGFTVPAESRGDGIRMLNMGELFKHPRIPSVEMARVDIPTTDTDRTLLSVNDLMFARRSLTLEGAGKCSIVYEVNEPTTWEGSIIRARLDRSLAWPPYYFYYFSSPHGRRLMETIVEQVAAAGIRSSDLARLEVPVPPLEEQQAIAEVLGALDDKIAANTKLAATADEYIRAGLSGLTADVTDIIPIEKLAMNRKELTDPNSLDPTDNYVGLEHIPRRSMWMNAAGTADAVTSTKAGFHAGDILFGKLRPYFHKVISAPFVGVCSTDILVLTPRSAELSGFVLASVASDYVVERVTAASEGTRMPRTSWKDLSAVEIAWPGEEKAREFSAKVSPLRQSIESLLQENSMLSATRDALLPQLMSGKLCVKDIEYLVAESGL